MGLKGITSVPKLPKARSAQLPTGPRFVPVGEQVLSDWAGDTDWPGFKNGQNSLTEQHAYGALGVIFNNPPREQLTKPPFFGGWPDWGYQVPLLEVHKRSIGSAVADFVVWQGGTQIVIRIVTEHYHTFSTSKKHGLDVIQQAQIEAAGYNVMDVFDNDLLHDPSGQKYVIAMKKAIGRISRIDPVVAGTAIRGSRGKVLGI